MLEDLGSHPTVADLLLGRDPAAAQAAVDAWVDAIADLHLAATDDVLDAYGRRLGASAPDIETHRIPGALDYSAQDFVRVGELVGAPPSASTLDALRDVAGALSPAPPVLTPADACPDNNLMTPDGVVLLDYEFAEVRHLVWDVAYLSVPWPTCWCAWRLPDAVATAAIARYRERVAPVGALRRQRRLRRRPPAGDAGVVPDGDVVAHRGRAGRGRQPSAGLDGPTLRPVVLHRLWLASHLPGPEPLTAYARDLFHRLSRRWGEPTLVLAPAFRAGDILIP